MGTGTTINAIVNRVVDGDTIRVKINDEYDDESLRICSLDTEESRASSGKPKTPWGIKAKEKAITFFSPGDEVVLEFPGNEDVAVCMNKHRGNFGRLLVFVQKGVVDFQETMIREGYSPYFCKYGNANFIDKHELYISAEREAMQNNLGVWNQIVNNGSEIRNYASLGTWWKLRARIIDRYRQHKLNNPDLLNTRLDYDAIFNLAKTDEEAIIFTELRSLKNVSPQSAIVDIGSVRQPFCLYLPDTVSDAGQQLINLLKTRYLPGDSDHPRRSYAYLKGKLKLYKDTKPEMIVNSADQITDDLPG